MKTDFYCRMVRDCSHRARSVVLAGAILGILACIFVFQNFQMDNNSENLFSPDIPWRQRQAEFDAAFPQRSDLMLVVVDGVTPERTIEAANTLKAAVMTRRDLFPIVRDIEGDEFFARNGLLFLSDEELRDTTKHIIDAQPFLAPLAADPSLLGIFDGLSAALSGIANGQGKLEDLTRAFNSFAATLEQTNAGRAAYLSWQELISGEKAATRETRRLIEIQPRLNFTALAPGEEASATLRSLATDAGLTPATGVRVRLTGPVPIADEEFLSLTDRAGLMVSVMLAAILATLWLAVRSVRLVSAILLTLFVGLVLTTAIGLAAIGRFNVISVAFIPLFVGIGVDFGIQFSVRYRAERFEHRDLTQALIRAADFMGPALTLAALATAACFYSFIPTSFSGVAELGFIAGNGMLIAYLLSGSLLPALLTLMNPRGEAREVGFAQLAGADAFLYRHRHIVVASMGVLSLGAALLLPSLEFDANPMDLRSARTESMATLFDLMRDPDTSPNTIEILAPTLDQARDLARRISQLPEVDHATTLDSFIPEGQPEKLALIADAAQLLDTTLNPFDMPPPPSREQTLASITATAANLRKAASGTQMGAAADAARRLAGALDMLHMAGESGLNRAEAALIPGLKTMLERLRASLMPQTVTADTLPPDLKREWLAADGRARVEVSAKGNPKDNATLARFAAAVRTIAPNATGAPISTAESGRTIVSAFVEAGILSFVAVVALLWYALKSVRDVVLTLGPLLAAALLTFATCVLLNLPLNFANIIVLPLLLGIGVAFHIYFVMAWRAGGHNFLQSSLSRAVLFSALTTATGFGTLWLSSHPGTASMGELLMISLGWTLAILVLLPALLELAKAKGH